MAGHDRAMGLCMMIIVNQMDKDGYTTLSTVKFGWSRRVFCTLVEVPTPSGPAVNWAEGRGYDG